MAGYSRVVLLGNLTADPELRYIPSGTAVTDLRLAVNEKRKNSQGEWVDEAVYVDVTLWGRTAEVAGEYLSKGSLVLIDGRLRLDTWESKDGQKRSKLCVVGDRMQMVGPRPGGGSGGGGTGGGPRGEGRKAPERGPAPPEEEFNQEPPEPAGGPPDVPF